MVIKDWQKEHFSVISDFLKELNKATSDFVLKGGTSLMMCYNLDRFSEDIDLDGKRNNKNIEKIVDEFCRKNNYSYNVNKDTDTVKRFMIHYSENNKPLKVEISFRQKNIRSDNLTNINDIMCIIKGDLFNAYKYSSESIRILKNNFFELSHYNNDEKFSIIVVVYNHIQLCNILGFKYEIDSIIEIFNFFDVIEYRKECLIDNINDDSIDWADPNEDMDNILEFMKEQREIYIAELNPLRNLHNITFFYIPQTYYTIFIQELPKDYFTPNICSYDLPKCLNFIKDETNQPIGIDEYPLWQFSEGISEISQRIKLLL